MATAALLGNMQATGLLVDVEYLQRCIPSVKQRLHDLESQAYSLAGHDFLLTSPQQIAAVLYGELNLSK
jgi:DNA polymerase-1